VSRTDEVRAAKTNEARPDGAEACDLFVADAEKVALVRAALMDTPEVAALADTFRVLGDPTRVRILDALATAELCVCDLATLHGLSESAVSHQLRLLRSMRLVRSRREGRMVFYALDDQHVVSLFHQGLRHVEEAGATRRPGIARPAVAPERRR
jgi:ArsR family transcriptional regulator, lead/cadmium/zinc/bismuth-responsive transcriptional repressor